MSYKELTGYLARLGTSSAEATQKLRVDLQAKLAFPFASVVVVLLAAPLAVRSSRGGTLLGMGTAIAASLGRAERCRANHLSDSGASGTVDARCRLPRRRGSASARG